MMNNLTNNSTIADMMAGSNAQEAQEQQPIGVGVNRNFPLSFAFGSLSNVAEKRQRRKIKNRESAARSRARKLAYNIQQEVEIRELEKENELLRKAIKVLSTKLAPKVIGDGKPSLKRSFSGPL